ncbi:MAG: extracellular solute-binding protein [Chloroflexi bacterium]|nr:extracellular solute-binding protein [Chloroflexota bacterium]
MKATGTLVMLTGIVLLALLVSCAPAAPPPPPTATAVQVKPTPAAAQPGAPAPAPTKAPAPATPAPAAKGPSPALAQLIEAAKKEGQISVSLTPNLTGKGMERLRGEIRETYGVDLNITYEPSSSYPALAAKAIAEHKAGATSTFDLMQSSDANLSDMVAAGIVQKSDWQPLVAEGTAPEMVQWDGHALVIYTGHVGLIYNPRLIPAAEVPKSFSNLADPKWRGKLAILSYTSTYMSHVFLGSADGLLNDLRAIMKNQPLVDTYARITTRYLAGEYPLAMMGSMYYEDIRRKNYPVEWKSIDFSRVSVHALVVLKNAAHPNAAKLMAVFIASPKGQKLIQEEASGGSFFYPGNYEYDIHQQDQKAGLLLFNNQQYPGAKEYLLSDKAKQIEKQIGDILRGQ